MTLLLILNLFYTEITFFFLLFIYNWCFYNVCVCFPLGYRLNKFCGEHLIVVNETPEPEPILPTQQRSLTDDNNFEHGSSRLDEENSVERDGPIAEALIQNEQMFHHLKILKPSPTELENERRKSISQSEKLEKPSPRKVYSQVCIYARKKKLYSKKNEKKNILK